MSGYPQQLSLNTDTLHCVGLIALKLVDYIHDLSKNSAWSKFGEDHLILLLLLMMEFRDIGEAPHVVAEIRPCRLLSLEL